MPFPKDPERQKLARESLRRAAERRWARPEEHEKARANFKLQLTPEMRQKMSAAGREAYKRDPQRRAILAAGREKQRTSGAKPWSKRNAAAAAAQAEESSATVRLSADERRRLIAERAKARREADEIDTGRPTP